MGLLPQVILGALLIVAFALSAHQRLSIASHTGPVPARQIAYLMRAHHQAAISQKLADHSLYVVTDFAPPTMTVAGDYTFVSCIMGKMVMTGAFVIGGPTTLMPLPIFNTAEANAIVMELRRQSVLSPELGQVGPKPWAVGYNNSPAALIASPTGIGLSDEILAGPIPAPCPLPNGVPTMITQVLP